MRVLSFINSKFYLWKRSTNRGAKNKIKSSKPFT